MPFWQVSLSATVVLLVSLVLAIGRVTLEVHGGNWPVANDFVFSSGVSILAVAAFGLACARVSDSLLGGVLLSSAAFLSNGGIAAMSGDQLLPTVTAAVALGLATVPTLAATALCGLAIAVSCISSPLLMSILPLVLVLVITWFRQSLTWVVGCWVVGAGLIGIILTGNLLSPDEVVGASLHSILGACGTGSGFGLLLTSVGLAVLAPIPWRNVGATSLALAVFVAALVFRAPLFACLALAVFAAHMARQVAIKRGPGIEIIAGIAAIMPSVPYVLSLARSFVAIMLPVLSAPSPLIGTSN